MSNEIRCGNCARLLGIRLDSGEVEVRRGNRVVRIIEGEVDCTRCQRSIIVSASKADTTSVSTRGAFRTGGGESGEDRKVARR